ncbi:MAG: hypothetical protein ACXWCV_06135, partial [Caldimonas sp.]
WYAAVGGLAVAHDYAAGGVALAQHVLSPLPPDFRPRSAIPQAPFRSGDALWLLAGVAGLLLFARRIQAWRKDRE